MGNGNLVCPIVKGPPLLMLMECLMRHAPRVLARART
jgi:hypothetical protein